MTTTPAELTDEHAWLAESVRLATENVAVGGGPFGALVVRDGRVLGSGTNQVTPTHDPTAHAEITAIRAACSEIENFRLDGCTLVSSCEPCPLCLAASLWARVGAVVYAADRHDAAAAGFDDRAFYDLFERPRSDWDIPIRRVASDEGERPFSAWLARPDRVEY